MLPLVIAVIVYNTWTPGRAIMQVATHSSSGARERYFDDDDGFSLQAMVIHIVCFAVL